MWSTEKGPAGLERLLGTGSLLEWVPQRKIHAGDAAWAEPQLLALWAGYKF
jgi:hypothetical protein